MQLFWQIAKTEAIASLALVTAAALVAGYGAFDASVHRGMISVAGSARIGFLGTLMFGFLPVTVIGVPAYIWLFHRGYVTWPRVIAAGATPGVFLSLFDMGLSLFALLCGVFIASATHAICKRWVSPNNSFKPNPLRGSA